MSISYCVGEETEEKQNMWMDVDNVLCGGAACMRRTER